MTEEKLELPPIQYPDKPVFATKIQLIKLFRRLTGRGLKECKELVETLPEQVFRVIEEEHETFEYFFGGAESTAFARDKEKVQQLKEDNEALRLELQTMEYSMEELRDQYHALVFNKERIMFCYHDLAEELMKRLDPKETFEIFSNYFKKGVANE